MNNATPAYPLAWPEGWERAPSWRRRKSRFISTLEKTRTRLYAELRRLGATNIVVSSNLPLRADGHPRSDVARYKIGDPGAAVYFTLRGKQMVMARDAYETVYDNIHSLTLAIEHLRGLERHGGAKMLERAFEGFAALASQANWKTVLGIAPGSAVDLGTVNILYHYRAKELAARGGDHEEMVALNIAIAQAREELRA